MIVLDANILLRAVLGIRVRKFISIYSVSAQLVTPESAIWESSSSLPGVIRKRQLDPQPFTDYLEGMASLVAVVQPETYAPFERAARRRLFRRDENDWPILACALAANCPIWTEDRDFFGCGIATWTTDRIEIFFEPFQL